MATATINPVIDTRQIGKFRVFDNVQEHWSDWKFQFVCWISLVQPAYPKYVDEAEKLTTPIDMPENETQKSLAIQLYAILAQSTQGRGLRAIRAVKTRCGFEAWRQLVELKEPKVATRRLASLANVMQPYFGREDEL